MPSGLLHGSPPVGRAAREERAGASRPTSAKFSGNAHRASSSRTRPRKPSASTPMAHESSTSVTVLLPRLARQHDVRRPCRAQRGDEVGAPLGVRRVGAGEADDGLAGVGRRHRVDASRWHRPPRRRRRRRRTGWWRRWRARCGRRSDPSWRGRPAARRARRAGPRRRRRSDPGAPARSQGARSGSASPRFGNSEIPVSGRERSATPASRAARTARTRCDDGLRGLLADSRRRPRSGRARPTRRRRGRR